jgi:hypothetical protein
MPTRTWRARSYGSDSWDIKQVKGGHAPLWVVVTIMGDLALAGIIFTQDLRFVTGKRTVSTDDRGN